MTEYDSIAKAYDEAEEGRSYRKHAVEPTFFTHLGDITGKKVLDLACGSGILTRKIKQLGATNVVGVDISAEMIALAQKSEQESPLGIRYVREDVAQLEPMGSFDLVTAGFLLHYASTREELFAMCKAIALNLTSGGRFVTINLNPEESVGGSPKYGAVTSWIDKPEQDGSRITCTIYANMKEACSFTTYYWSKKTYEEALSAAGLENIQWNSVVISQEGETKFGKEYWNDIRDESYLTILTASKK